MRPFSSRILIFLCAFCTFFHPVSAASLVEGTDIRVGSFTFPQAAYTGADEEAERLSQAFRSQLASTLQLTGLTVVVPVKETYQEEDAEPEKQEKAVPIKDSNKKISEEDGADAEEGDLFKDKDDDEQSGIAEDGLDYEEQDDLMAAVEKAERVEKEEAESAGTKKKVAESSAKGTYVISGTITQYEEHVGVPVSTGKTKRAKAEVTLHCLYQVKNPAGKVIISEETAASSARVVAETVDIYVALQNLSKKVFFEASINIAERVSGKKRVKSKDDAEPGSEDDEYADSPGKRLKPKKR